MARARASSGSRARSGSARRPGQLEPLGERELDVYQARMQFGSRGMPAFKASSRTTSPRPPQRLSCRRARATCTSTTRHRPLLLPMRACPAWPLEDYTPAHIAREYGPEGLRALRRSTCGRGWRSSTTGGPRRRDLPALCPSRRRPPPAARWPEGVRDFLRGRRRRPSSGARAACPRHRRLQRHRRALAPALRARGSAVLWRVRTDRLARLPWSWAARSGPSRPSTSARGCVDTLQAARGAGIGVSLSSTTRVGYAGASTTGPAALQAMIDLEVRAVVDPDAVLPARHDRARPGRGPQRRSCRLPAVPYLAVYAASKAFVLSLTESMATSSRARADRAGAVPGTSREFQAWRGRPTSSSAALRPPGRRKWSRPPWPRSTAGSWS